MTDSHGRVDDNKCFNEYGNKYVNLQIDSVKNGSVENISKYCSKLAFHGSYHEEAMENALPFAQKLGYDGNNEVTLAIKKNCGYFILNITTGNYTLPIYPIFQGELSITSCKHDEL